MEKREAGERVPRVRGAGGEAGRAARERERERGIMEPSSTKPEAAEAEAKPGQDPEAAVAEPTAPAAEKKEEPSGAGRDGEGAAGTKATEGGEPSPKRAKVNEEGGHEDGEVVKDDDANGAPGPAPTSKDPAASNAKQTAEEQEKKPEAATVEAAAGNKIAMAANAKEAQEANNNNGNRGQQGVGKTGDNMGGQKRAEIYTYNAKDMIFSLAWSVRKDKKFRLAAGSFVEEYQNKVEILYLDETKGEFGLSEPALSFSHPFPATKVGESILSVVFYFSPSGRSPY